jgi:hypothetical protein
MAPSFIAYVDESGDEGFRFLTPPDRGSSEWFCLSAVVVRRIHEPQAVLLVDDVRQQLNKPHKFTLHFRNLHHNQKVMFAQRIARTSALRIITVLVHKRSLLNSSLIAGSRLYFYATRILLERISWLCRDAVNRHKDGDGICKVIFSNRTNMSYDEMRDYLTLLQNRSEEIDCRIDWTAIRPDQVASLHAHKSKGLQIVDAVASGFFSAFEPDRFDNIEDRYAKTLLPLAYRHKDKLNRYGVKICCGDKMTEAKIEAGLRWLEGVATAMR